MPERNGNSETGKYLDRKGEAAKKMALSSHDNLVSRHPIFIFKIENESIVVCEPKSKEMEEDMKKRKTRPRNQQNAVNH